MNILVFFPLSILWTVDYSNIPLLRWAGPEGTRPETYEEWIAQNPYSDFSYKMDRIEHGDGRAGNIAILTQQNIANALTDEINQLINNLQREGFTIFSYQIAGGTPESLRTFLQSLYNNHNIEGALFIGNLPVAWFEIANDFGQYGYTQFPIDLFYMDLNGIWLDTMNTGNGKYDGHTGNINPEIYIGRLTPTGIGTDTVVLKNYFRKNNAYRWDTLALQRRALFFCDDDWIPWAPQWAYELAVLYPDTNNYWHAETTRASIYRSKLNTPRAWVSVFAHSSPNLHQFTYNNGNAYDYYYANEYTTQNPPANFYNHFACSFARYTTSGYGGGQAIFNQGYGLGAIGSTKTGSMLEFYYFYQPLSQQKTLGQAFKDWFTYITSNGVTFDELCWHYGMTLLGDPWLKPTGHNLSLKENENESAHKPVIVRSSVAYQQVIIEINIKEPCAVKIATYDCLGRELNILVNRKFPRGNYRIFWNYGNKNMSNEPAGVYIIKSEIANKMYTTKVVLLK
ncbi:MAG: hypothetical protein ABIL86_02065 [candidate division WOR-3 bacterium]